MPYDHSKWNFEFLNFQEDFFFDRKLILTWDIPNIGYDRLKKKKMSTCKPPLKDMKVKRQMIGYRTVRSQIFVFGIFTDKWTYFEASQSGIVKSTETESSVQEYDKHDVRRLVDGRSEKYLPIKYNSFSIMNITGIDSDIEMIVNNRRYMVRHNPTVNVLVESKNIITSENDQYSDIVNVEDGYYKLVFGVSVRVIKSNIRETCTSQELEDAMEYINTETLILSQRFKMAYTAADLNMHANYRDAFNDLDFTNESTHVEELSRRYELLDYSNINCYLRVKNENRLMNVTSYEKKQDNRVWQQNFEIKEEVDQIEEIRDNCELIKFTEMEINCEDLKEQMEEVIEITEVVIKNLEKAFRASTVYRRSRDRESRRRVVVQMKILFDRYATAKMKRDREAFITRSIANEIEGLTLGDIYKDEENLIVTKFLELNNE
jgi:hypothetical protein